ncbi:methylmalonyl-CoA mutase [Dyadobacter jejuensis]|uniref:Methylmalonyl-CoA mutase n=1 Tax=Dyadobacter jejuensis TaxID=1082580 RepID=A0A316ANZ4_9BACT|nr:methylmalonyl-CoA mutase family protein [Dyadobacter jejuensis]PWJ58520.1 methylmalonyl-CoA mutase [Dyadobacter jejuensis]
MCLDSSISEFSVPNPGDWQKKAEAELHKPLSQLTPWEIGSGVLSDRYYKKLFLTEAQLHFNQQAQKKTKGLVQVIPVRSFDMAVIHLENTHMTEMGGLWLDYTTWSAEQRKTFLEKRKAIPHLTVYALASEGHEVWMGTELPTSSPGGHAIDPLALWMSQKTPHLSYMDRLAQALKTKHPPGFFSFMIDGQIYEAAGGDPVLELSLITAALVFYLDFFTDRGIPPQSVLEAAFFTISIGPNYLSEIAKIRALRVLVNQIGRYYEIPPAAINPYIVGSCSERYYKASESYLNLARMTTQAMSIAMGGCDAILMPAAQVEPPSAGLTLPQNIPLLLGYEAKIGHIVDPTAGAYLFEQMTQGIKEAAWRQFLDWESYGGILQAFDSGLVRAKLDEAWERQLSAYSPDSSTIPAPKPLSQQKPHSIYLVPRSFSSKTTNL